MQEGLPQVSSWSGFRAQTSSPSPETGNPCSKQSHVGFDRDFDGIAGWFTVNSYYQNEETMKKQESVEKPANISYSALAFSAVLFTLVVVLFFGALLILK